MPHVLIVGGTGMLKDAVLHFARHGCTVSVIARSPVGFNKLIESKDEPGFINPVKVDYRDYFLLKDKIISAMESYGDIETCVCWIHSNAPDAPYIIADILNDRNTETKYYHVLGSEYANPFKENKNIEKSFEKYKNIIYKKIILGFIIEDNHSRWLTDMEIGNGVIDAVNLEKDTFTIGKTEPWERKP